LDDGGDSEMSQQDFSSYKGRKVYLKDEEEFEMEEVKESFK
jgi:hypothetical protein